MADVFKGKPDARQSPDVDHEVSRFRPTYRALTADEKALHDEIKTAATALESLIDRLGDTPDAPRVWRYRALAITALEESVMWAVKGLTS